MKYKVLFELRSGSSFIQELDGKTNLTPHFTLEECAYKGNAKYQFILNDRVDLFLKIMEEFRADWYKKAFKPNSFYRPPEFNDTLKNAVKNSKHEDALAMDIPVPSMNDSKWNNFVGYFKQIPDRYGVKLELGRYTWGIHVGIDITYTNKKFYTFDKR